VVMPVTAMLSLMRG